MAAKFEISKDHAGKFRFHLKAPNGEIIAASQGYETKAGAEKGVEAVKTHAPTPRLKALPKPNPPSALPIDRLCAVLQCGRVKPSSKNQAATLVHTIAAKIPL